MKSFVSVPAVGIDEPTVTRIQNPAGRAFVCVRLSDSATVHVNAAEDGDALSAAFAAAAQKLRDHEAGREAAS